MKKIVLSLLLVGVFMISPLDSYGAEPALMLNNTTLSGLEDVESSAVEVTNAEESIEETYSVPDESTLAAAVATVSETTDIGWIYENGIWFYRDENGDLVHGWRTVDGKLYYFDPTYAYMYCNGWQYIQAEDKRYYFTSSGDAYTGWKEDEQYGDRYYFYEGQYTTRWVKQDEKWYYIKDGRMVTDEYNYKVYGVCYGLDSNGVMRTGWNRVDYMSDDGRVDTDWYYYETNGAARNGWLKYNDVWYYLYDGWMADDGVREIGTIVYAFNTNGIMKSEEWHYDWWNQKWYYLDESGAGHNGWLQQGSVWYYCNNGEMYCNGWFQTGTNEYSQFDASGVWLGSSSTMPTE